MDRIGSDRQHDPAQRGAHVRQGAAHEAGEPARGRRPGRAARGARGCAGAAGRRRARGCGSGRVHHLGHGRILADRSPSSGGRSRVATANPGRTPGPPRGRSGAGSNGGGRRSVGALAAVATVASRHVRDRCQRAGRRDVGRAGPVHPALAGSGRTRRRRPAPAAPRRSGGPRRRSGAGPRSRPGPGVESTWTDASPSRRCHGPWVTPTDWVRACGITATRRVRKPRRAARTRPSWATPRFRNCSHARRRAALRGGCEVHGARVHAGHDPRDDLAGHVVRGDGQQHVLAAGPLSRRPGARRRSARLAPSPCAATAAARRSRWPGPARAGRSGSAR